MCEPQERSRQQRRVSFLKLELARGCKGDKLDRALLSKVPRSNGWSKRCAYRLLFQLHLIATGYVVEEFARIAKYVRVA